MFATANFARSHIWSEVLGSAWQKFRIGLNFTKHAAGEVQAK